MIQETHEWTEDNKLAFYTALDHLDEVMCRSGKTQEEIDQTASFYFEQKRSGLVEPSRVIERMALAASRRAN